MCLMSSSGAERSPFIRDVYPTTLDRMGDLPRGSGDDEELHARLDSGERRMASRLSVSVLSRTQDGGDADMSDVVRTSIRSRVED